MRVDRGAREETAIERGGGGCGMECVAVVTVGRTS